MEVDCAWMANTLRGAPHHKIFIEVGVMVE